MKKIVIGFFIAIFYSAPVLFGMEFRHTGRQVVSSKSKLEVLVAASGLDTPGKSEYGVNPVFLYELKKELDVMACELRRLRHDLDRLESGYADILSYQIEASEVKVAKYIVRLSEINKDLAVLYNWLRENGLNFYGGSAIDQSTLAYKDLSMCWGQLTNECQIIHKRVFQLMEEARLANLAVDLQ